MNFDDFSAAVDDAERTLRFADRLVTKLAGTLRGRLRLVPSFILRDLKRELRGFNMITGAWKE